MSQRVNVHDATGTILNIPGQGMAFCHGTTVPADASVGYVTGCLFLHTDGGNGTSIYVNEGSATSSGFKAMTVEA